MLSIANNPSIAIKYMKQGKDFFIVENKSDQYNFYNKIAKSLQAYDKDGKPVDYIKRSLTVNLNLNRLLSQLGSILSIGAEYVLKLNSEIINHHKDKQLNQIVELSKAYRITLQYDKRILFESVEK